MLRKTLKSVFPPFLINIKLDLCGIVDIKIKIDLFWYFLPPSTSVIFTELDIVLPKNLRVQDWQKAFVLVSTYA